jgi:hypothetical protein
MPNSRAARKLLVAGACAVLLTTGVAACGDSGSGGGGAGWT